MAVSNGRYEAIQMDDRDDDDDDDAANTATVDDEVLRALTGIAATNSRRRKYDETVADDDDNDDDGGDGVTANATVKRSRSKPPKTKVAASNPLDNIRDVRDSWTRETGGEYGRQRRREEQEAVRREARRPLPSDESAQLSLPPPPPNRGPTTVASTTALRQTTNPQKLRERSREELLAERRAIRQQIIERKRAQQRDEMNSLKNAAGNNDTVDRAISLIEHQRQTDELLERQKRIDQALGEFIDPAADSMPMLFRSATPPPTKQHVEPFIGNRGNSVKIVPPVRRTTTKISTATTATRTTDSNAETPSANDDDDDLSPLQMLAQPTIGIASVSDMQHLRHVMRVIDACTPPDDRNAAGARVWLGLPTFLNYYFASTLQLFLGDRVVLRILQIPSTSEFGAKFYVLGNQRYSLMLLADFDYWERLLSVATALPDIYFENGANTLARTYQRLAANDVPRQAPRYRLDTDTMFDYRSKPTPVIANPFTTTTNTTTVITPNNETLVVRDGNNMNCNLFRRTTSPEPAAPSPPPPPSSSPPPLRAAVDGDRGDSMEQIELQNTESLDMAVASLCLVHRFEMLLEKDFRNKLPNYVTLAKMFTRNTGSINPFRIDLFSN